MRKVTLVLLSVTMMIALAASALAQRNPRGTANLTLKGKTVSVEYGRPSLKGRTVDQMLSQLKAGDVWRLGADKSTTFTTGLDLAFGDVTAPAGEYSLWMQKQADNSWKLVFNKQHGQWGTQHDAAQDLVSAPLNQSQPAESIEMVTITLAEAGEGGVINIEWGTMKVTASFTAK
jgi:predicted phage tail protein